MTKKAEFKLFANCIIVRGATRSTVCDLQRNDVHFIPNAFADLMQERSLCECDDFDEETAACIKYLVENDLGHFVTDPDQFPELSLEYTNPGTLSHAIIELSDQPAFDVAKALHSLSDAGVKFVDFWIRHKMDRTLLETLVRNLKPTRILTVNICMPFAEGWTSPIFEYLFVSFQRLYSITLYGANIEKVENILGRQVIHTKGILDARQCGKIHTHCFSCNIKTFSESQHFNTCLNGKITITSEGLVKNCPAMQETFGRIDAPLNEVVSNKGFQRFWNIKKDDINICRDCEFRHVCTDCRAFLETPEDIYSRPLKCGYDPYTGEWKSWSTHPQKKYSISYYGLEAVVESDK
ncbi:MAG TPA: grasp-with-spasm system SPASM domain peptide maturase [Chryseosolibacter sp.]